MAVMTVKQWCDRLKYMALKRKSSYSNRYPYNCCYIYSNGSISADCIGLVKSLINEPSIYNRTKPAGYYVTPGQRIPDGANERGILNLCSGVSYSFTNLVPGEYLYMPGHAGVYVGDFTDGSGTVNVIECTPAFGGGITTSYVDSAGRRLNHKGGSQVARWEAHGKLYRYIDYGASPKPTPSKKIAVDGAWGPATTSLAVYVYSTIHKQKITSTNKVTSQMAGLKRYHLNCETSSWQYTSDSAAKGSDLIRAMQKVMGQLTVDGQAGPSTIKRLQHELQDYGAGNIDGYCGYKTVCAFQRWLNSKVN